MKLYLTVNVATLNITTGTTLPSARAGLPYSVKLGAAGGITPLTWSISKGVLLPPGLKLHPATGVISGIPSGSGAWDFTVGVTDSESPAQADDIRETLTVLSPVAVTTSSPPQPASAPPTRRS